MIMSRLHGWHMVKIGVCRVEELIDRFPLRGQPAKQALKMSGVGTSQRVLVPVADLGNRTT
jgi:hypothetical protein